MAGLVETYLQDIRVAFPNNLDRDEWRFTRYGLLTATKEQTVHPMSIISEDLRQKALDSEGRALQVPVMKLGALTVKNQRSCTIGDYENESAMVDVTWATLVTDFSMMKAQHHKNEVSYLQDFNKKMLLVQNLFANYIENAIYTKLDTDKSAIYNSTLVGATGKYPLIANTMQVYLAEQETFFNDVDVIMNQDDFWSPEWLVLGSTPLMSPVRHYLNQGASNDERLDYQFGPYSFRFSNQVVDGGGKKATGFIMPYGSIGLLTRVNIDAKMNNKASDGTSWETAFLDTLGFEVGVMHKSKCTDKSDVKGLEHLEATMVENFQFSIDFALLTPYNSDAVTKAGSIKKFEFLTV